MTDSDLKIHSVAAHCNNNGIGIKGKLPWNLPHEYQHYTRTTVGNPPKNKKNVVLVGRKTWKCELKCGLYKDRFIFVMSTTLKSNNAGGLAPDAVVSSLHDVDSLLKSAQWKDKVHDVFCAGGSEIYKLVLNSPYCGKLFLTRIYHDFACDTFFPELDHTFKKLSTKQFSEIPQGMQEENGIKWEVEVYEKQV